MVDLVAVLKAVADPVRVRLLALLEGRELPVAEIVGAMGMGQSRVSRHLKILVDAGLLVSRRDGSWVRYALRRNGEASEVLECLRRFLPRPAAELRRLESSRRAAARRRRRFFDAVAGRWDVMRREVLGDVDLAGAVLEALPSCRTAADLGCGTGEFLPVLARRAGRVIGVDASPAMLEAARRRWPGADLRLGTLEHLPLADGEADACLCSLVLHHLADPGEGLREVARVLRVGGVLVVVEFLPHRDETMRRRFGDLRLGFSAGEMVGLLAEAGLEAATGPVLPLRRGFRAAVYRAVRRR